MSNTSLVKGWDGGKNTWCNRATMNVVEAVESGMAATGSKTNISLPWENANNLTDWLAKSPNYKSLTMDDALKQAKAGNLVITAWKNPVSTKSGHLTTLSVGDNIAKGVSAHIGGTNGFRKLSGGAYYADMMPSVKYYMLIK